MNMKVPIILDTTFLPFHFPYLRVSDTLVCMARNISNKNGRALEYQIIRYINSSISQFSVTLTNRAVRDQERDKLKFDTLIQDLKISYQKCAVIVHNWLRERLNSTEITIDRLPDSAAKEGDITDIRIKSGTQVINLSIKHNHSALKHQRPPTTAERCGYSAGSMEDILFRGKYRIILEKFLEKTKELSPKAQYFRDLIAIDKDFINNNLYLPVCKLVAVTINNLCNNEKKAQNLFSFLVGSTDFYKIIDYKYEVVILDFNTIDKVSSVAAKLRGKSYVDLEFSNGWIVGMRLHTAASALGKSLKFDTQPKSIPSVPRVSIPKP